MSTCIEMIILRTLQSLHDDLHHSNRYHWQLRFYSCLTEDRKDQKPQDHFVLISWQNKMSRLNINMNNDLQEKSQVICSQTSLKNPGDNFTKPTGTWELLQCVSRVYKQRLQIQILTIPLLYLQTNASEVPVFIKRAIH